MVADIGGRSGSEEKGGEKKGRRRSGDASEE